MRYGKILLTNNKRGEKTTINWFILKPKAQKNFPPKLITIGMFVD